MDVEDFIPDIISQKHSSPEELLKYRELSELAKDEEVLSPFYNHQVLPSRLLAYFTNILFLKYPMGSGKTTTGDLTGFLLRNSMPYDKNKVVILGPNKNIVALFKQELEMRFGEIYINRQGEFTTHTPKVDFTFSTFESFINKVFLRQRKDKREPTQQEINDSLKKAMETYSNATFIMDEASWLRESDKESEGKIIYRYFRKFFSLLTGHKVVFMSGTFMVNGPEDFVSLANLVLPEDNQLPLDLGDKSQKDIEYILAETVGKNILYLDELKINVEVKEMKNTKDYGPYNEVREADVSYVPFYLSLTGYQREVYRRIKESSSKPKAFYTAERTASIFVYPEIPHEEREENKKEVDRVGGKEFDFFFVEGNLDKKIYKVGATLSDGSIIPVLDTENGYRSFRWLLENNLLTFSAKMDRIVKDANNDTEHGFVVYSFYKWVGTYVFGEILKIHDYKEWEPMERRYKKPKGERKSKEDRYHLGKENMPADKRKRFAILEGSPKRIEKILDAYNSPENMYGDYIKILILPHGLIFGTNIFNGRKMYHLGYSWNNAVSNQANSRLLRGYQALRNFRNPKDRYVEIYYMTAVLETEEDENGNIIDYGEMDEDGTFKNALEVKAYLSAKRKEVDIDKTYRAMKNVSVDRGINNSRDKFKIPKNQIENNYHLFYFKYEIRNVKQVIKDIFMYQDEIYFDDLCAMIPQYTRKDIIYTLNDMSENRDELQNKRGEIRFITEEKGVVFLHDNYNIFERKKYNPMLKLYKLEKDVLQYSITIIKSNDIEKLKAELRSNPNRIYLDEGEIPKIDSKIAAVLFEELYGTKYDPAFQSFMDVYSKFHYDFGGLYNIHWILAKSDSPNSVGSLLLKDVLFRRYNKETKQWEDFGAVDKVTGRVPDKALDITEKLNKRNMAEYEKVSRKKYVGLVTTTNEFKVIIFNGELKYNKGNGEISASGNPRGKDITNFEFDRRSTDTVKIPIKEIYKYFKKDYTPGSATHEKIFYVDLRKFLAENSVIIYR